MAGRQLTFLGTGTSTGVPILGCTCDVCTSSDRRNRRNRTAALITTPNGRILIDTPPELRLELLNVGVGFAHAVLYTHYHADHLYGLDDLRQFPKHIGGPVPIYCADDVETVIRQSFGYIFGNDPFSTVTAYLPKVEFHRIKPGEAFQVLGQRVLPIELVHDKFRVLGFRMGDMAYCTDVNRIPEMSLQLLQDLDVLVLDALRFRPHPAHFGLDEALKMIEYLKPRRAYLTHLAHDMEHETVEQRLPAHIRVAYDGLTLDF